MKIPEILLVETDHRPGSLVAVLTIVADANIVIEGLACIRRTEEKSTWELTVDITEEEAVSLPKKINTLPNATILGTSDRVFKRHRGGKISVVSQSKLENLEQLRDLYTPGVARVCLAIRDDPSLVNTLTNLPNTVAIVTNGTAILGLGDIGPVAGLPVMEGKAALFNELAGISGVPILINSHDPREIIDAIVTIAPSFGAIQLEDIAAPECFEIEEALVNQLPIPVMHDDQHGTAVVVLASLLFATRGVGVSLQESIVGQIGLGAAGLGIARLLMAYGIKQVLGTDLNQEPIARLESMGGQRCDLEELMARADVVVATTGVQGLVKAEWVRPGQVILALTNPEPEIEPELALSKGAVYAADGKSVNNVLAFPGVFRGALDASATKITKEMLIAAALCLHTRAPKDELVPDPLERSVHVAVADAVARASSQT